MTFNAREWWVEWVQWVATSHARENGWGFKKYAILIGPGIRNPLNPPNPQLAGKEIPETAADGHVRQADGDPPEKTWKNYLKPSERDNEWSGPHRCCSASHFE